MCILQFTAWLEDMELPEEYRIGLEKQGEKMNNSSRGRNGFGGNRKALFPKAGVEKGEDRNWLASFTKAGCIACRDENGATIISRFGFRKAGS